jgi:hypothetical protein
MCKNIGLVLLAAVIGATCLGLSEKIGVPGEYGFISAAEAIVNRSTTPVNVAGVARTTARQCAHGSWDPYGMRCDSSD